MTKLEKQIIKETRKRKIKVDRKNPIRSMGPGRNILLNIPPQEITLTFKVGPDDYDYLEKLYQESGAAVSS